MTSRAYLSIGDVLSLLRQEFPDVTISKIRFLESQGLVNPERTPSGYRKFYEPDVERLRWVLRQQREHFLPLKVIKGRLEEVGEEKENGHPPDLARHTAHEGRRAARSEADDAVPATAAAGGRAATLSSLRTSAESSSTHPSASSRGQAAPARLRPQPETATGAKAKTEAEPERPSRAGRARTATPAPVLAEGDMTIEEVESATNCPATAIAALESYGLLCGRVVGGVVYYGPDALEVARLAAAFAAFGVEPRHLRLHKHAAEREAGFVEQVVLPLLRQRNPESRQRAHQTVEELSRLGQELRSELMAKALRDKLGG